MSEEADVDTGLMIEDEQMTEDKGEQAKSSLLEKQSTVIMTGEEFVRESMPDRGIEKVGSGLSELGISLLGGFQSLNSGQSSEKDRMIPYVPPLEELRVLRFEDTLSEEDHRNFNVIYESLLLEGKAGNLTDLTLGMVLAEKPPTCLPVMHERVKHLIISSEKFKEKKKAEYDAQARVKQTSRGKGIGKCFNGIRFMGVGGKGKKAL